MTQNTTVFNPEVFTSTEEQEERPTDLEEEIDVAEDSARAKAKQRIRREDVWREMFLTSNGRDKAFVRYNYLLYTRSTLNAYIAYAVEIDPVCHSGVLGFPLFFRATRFLEGSRLLIRS